MSTTRAVLKKRTRPPIQRSYLVDRTLPLGDQRLTIVSGPAGSGKTTLLAGWYSQLQAAGNRPSWFTFGQHCGTLLSTVAQLVFALRHLEEPPPASLDDPETELRRINDELPASDRVLFLDDVGFVDQTIVEECVELFLALPGPSWQLAVAGRRPLRPPLRLARPEEVRAIGPPELRLSDAAVLEILASYRSGIEQERLSPVVAKLGGWAAGAHLAGRVLTTRPGSDELVDRFDGRDVDIADFLETEVFSGLRPSDQDFLVRSSILAEPTAHGCRAVTADHFSAARLAALGRQNALLVVQDDGTSYRWTPLARDFLLAKLGKRPAHEAVMARRRARTWAVETRRYDEAVEHSAALEDWDATVDILLDAGLDVLTSSRPARIVSSLQSLPVALLAQEAGVAVVAAVTTWSLGEGDRGTVDDWLDHAERQPRGRAPASAVSLQSAIDIARASFGSITSPRRRVLAKRALDAAPGDETSWSMLALAALGTAAYLDGEPDVARTAVLECLRLRPSLRDDGESSLSDLVATSALGTLALIEIDAEEPTRAEALLSAVAMLPSGLLGGDLGSGMVRLARARCAFDRETSRAAIDDMVEVGERALLPEVGVLAMFCAAAASSLLGHEEESARYLADAERQLAALTDPGRFLLQQRAAVVRQIESRMVEGTAANNALTDREVEVLQLLGSDLSRREIAGQLFLAHNTVKTYIQRLYQKLGVSSRPAAVAEARERGWLP